MNSVLESSTNIIVEDNGNLYYVNEPKKIKYKKTFAQCFSSHVQDNLATSDQARYSKTIDVARFRTFTFLIKNNGLSVALCQVEMSPDGVNWGSFGESEYTISPGQMQVIVPQYFLQFARIKLWSKIPGFSSVITIWFQGQR